MRIEAGRTQFIGTAKLNLEISHQPEIEIIPGRTATHEAMHVIGAKKNRTGVESATIVAGDGYLGLTILSKPDAVAAMAPHSMGAGGTGHDVFIAGHIGNAGAAESAARGIIRSNMDEVHAVAVALEKKKTITSADIDVFELHDAFSIMAALSLEASGFAERGQGVRLALDNEISIQGRVPVCTRGGLKARGHPVGATGMYQIVEATLQLRGLAGKNQVKDATIAMAQNIGRTARTGPGMSTQEQKKTNRNDIRVRGVWFFEVSMGR